MLAPNLRNRFLEQLGPEYADAYPKILEQNYPHVLEKISSLWGANGMQHFFEDLMLTQRTDRRGFSVEAFDELLVLISVYRKLGLMNEPPKRDGDVWSWIGEVGIEAGERHNA